MRALSSVGAVVVVAGGGAFGATTRVGRTTGVGRGRDDADAKEAATASDNFMMSSDDKRGGQLPPTLSHVSLSVCYALGHLSRRPT